MKKFETPDVLVTKLDVEDVITTSNSTEGSDTEIENGGEWN